MCVCARACVCACVRVCVCVCVYCKFTEINHSKLLSWTSCSQSCDANRLVYRVWLEEPHGTVAPLGGGARHSRKKGRRHE